MCFFLQDGLKALILSRAGKFATLESKSLLYNEKSSMSEGRTAGFYSHLGAMPSTWVSRMVTKSKINYYFF